MPAIGEPAMPRQMLMNEHWSQLKSTLLQDGMKN